jgi:site-specific DNA recombinase
MSTQSKAERPADAKRAGVYLRVSSKEQAEEGLSLEAHEQQARDYAFARGWIVVGVYSDAGVKGTLDSRPELDRMLADVERGLLDVVIVFKLDRLGRTQRQLHRNAGLLKDAGADLVSMSENIDTSTPQGRMAFGMLAIFAEMEATNISERVRSVQAAQKAKGLHGGGAKYGFDKDKGVLSVIPFEAEIVRRIYAERLEGRKQAEIARTLTLTGVPAKKGGDWWQGTIRRILSDPVYAGLNAEGEPCRCGHEEIVDIETWQRAQLLAEGDNSSARRGREPIGLLFRKRMLRCGLCGEPMVPRRERKRAVYLCIRRHRLGVEGCPMPKVPGELLDAGVLNHFQNVGLSLEDTCRDFALAHDRQLAEARLMREQSERAEQHAVESLTRIKRDYREGKIRSEDWEEFRAELEPERDAARAEATRHRAHEQELTERTPLADAETAVLEYLAEIRTSIAQNVASQTSLQGVHAALLTLFSGFTVHCTAHADPERLPTLLHRDLMLPGYGGLIVEPHVRPEAIATRAERGSAVELHRIPLAVGRNIESAPTPPE